MLAVLVFRLLKVEVKRGGNLPRDEVGAAARECSSFQSVGFREPINTATDIAREINNPVLSFNCRSVLRFVGEM